MPGKGQYKKDIIGKRFGRLIVLNEHKIEGRRRYKWKCKCDCGNETWVERNALLHGNTKSCGCLFYDTMRIERGKSSRNRRYRNYKYDAQKRNINFKLSVQDFENIATQNCYYCGCVPAQIQKADGNNGDWVYNGIDRLNNSWGYIKNNCVPCCHMCNMAKGKLSEREFLSWIKRVYLNLKTKGKIDE